MSDELPEDVAQWPNDPYALLNVRHGADGTELKRAYARLIRRFKPEQYPEQFRRIREAYDFVLRYSRYYEPFRHGGDLAPGSPTQADVASASTSPDPMTAVWESAVGGDPAGAYRRLKDLHETSLGADAAIRLYWLLVLFPELDSTREPMSWLAAALVKSDLTGPARELFRRELLDRPHSALHPDIDLLWHVPAVPERIAELADWRWQSAALLEQWPLIEKDVKLLRGSVRSASESVWLRLLAVAADLLAWVDPWQFNPIWDDLLNEIHALDHLARECPFIFDRLDYLELVVADWRKWKGSPFAQAELMPLVVVAWTRPADELQPVLLQFADRIGDQPLGWFDQLWSVAAGQTALTFLADQMRSLPALGNESQAPPADLGFATFTGSQFWEHYWACHRELLEYCLGRQVSPEFVAEYAAAIGVIGQNGVPPTQLVKQDGALRMVYHAVQRVGG